MSAITTPVAPTQKVQATVGLALLIFLALTYLVAFDQGGLGSMISDRLLASGGVLHELFHDARHVLGVPCH